MNLIDTVYRVIMYLLGSVFGWNHLVYLGVAMGVDVAYTTRTRNTNDKISKSG